ncbi:MAG: zinc-ribbon domain-containing protein [bacterium]
MIVECSNCHAKYNVDEDKIPSMGIKVKCHKCQNIIFIQKETPAPEPAQPETPVPPSEPPVEPTAQVPPTEPAPSPPAQPEEPSPAPEQPEEASVPTEPEVPTPEPPEPEVAPPEPEVPVPQEQIEQAAPLDVVMPSEPEVAAPTKPLPTAPEEAPMSEEDKKLHERARRLAKALASDLVLYNQDKVEEGLRNGTLAKLLGSEIRRSWEYYCQQIPKHIVDGTDYFKDQLNKIVGKGKEIFK